MVCTYHHARCELCAPTKARRIDVFKCPDGTWVEGYRQCDTC